jgi:F-type H+-transporting ATPase subunit delta
MAESDDINARDARTAAEIQADVGMEHLADVYAEALLGAAENAGCTEEVVEQFDWLMTDLLDPFPRFEAILTSGLISHEEKAGIFDRVLEGECSPLMVSLLKVVSRHGRLECLRAIHRQTKLLHDRLRGRMHIELTTATPVSEAAAGRIAESLRAVLGGEPVIQRVTDPELIGGAVLRVGDMVYDRSAHEIQSRRDRFRDPAGN